MGHLRDKRRRSSFLGNPDFSSPLCMLQIMPMPFREYSIIILFA
ncbi:hypothetical protein [Azospirillum doebereinerae]